MTWRDRYQTGSFRGVEFRTRGHEALIAGRRVATHEYPGADDPYHEDIGGVSKEFELDAYILGPDYDRERDRLIEVCNEEGPGVLVHPYAGTFMASCTGLRQRETSEEGGIVRLSMTFKRGQQNRNPTAATDTGDAIASQANAVDAALIEQFVNAFEI